jgi:hypothetical protein
MLFSILNGAADGLAHGNRLPCCPHIVRAHNRRSMPDGNHSQRQSGIETFIDRQAKNFADERFARQANQYRVALLHQVVQVLQQ